MSQSVKRPAAKTVRKPSGSRGPVESQVESNPVPPAPKIPEATKALKPESEPMNETTMTYRADPGLSTLPPLPPLGQVQAVPPPHLSMTATEPEPAAEPLRWRPMLQVDELLWPSVEDRLRTLAARWMDQLAAGLTNVLERGQKVLGFGCRTSGEGVTTLLTGAARRLVEQGLRVAVVDANLAGPNLAQSLGLLPQVGWADMLEGRLPLEEVAVESLADGLVVLPLAEPLEGVALEPTRIAATLQTLAESYDVVLVDLGALESSESSGTQREIARRMDAVLLVQNVRSTAADRLAGLRCDLAAEGVVHAGTIQNFVAG
jgi:Mrp family chromosome partitioning ATPase